MRLEDRQTDRHSQEDRRREVCVSPFRLIARNYFNDDLDPNSGRPPKGGCLSARGDAGGVHAGVSTGSSSQHEADLPAAGGATRFPRASAEGLSLAAAEGRGADELGSVLVAVAKQSPICSSALILLPG